MNVHVEASDHSIPPAVEEAIDWKVLLDSGEATEQDQRDFVSWLRSSPSNEAAWLDLSSSLTPFGAARRLQPAGPGSFTEAAMKRAVGRRKAMFALAGLAVTGSAAAVISDRYIPIGALTADQFTRTGENKTIMLADGSEMTLGARTAVDLDIGSGRRLIALREGEAMVRSQPAATPLTARAGFLTLQADDGSFVLRRRNDRTSITAIDQAVRVFSEGLQPITLAAGQSITQTGGQVFVRPAELKLETAWVNGLLVVDDHPLAFVVNSLRPYFVGVIRLDPTVASTRVTGVFPLTDPQAAIDMIGKTLNLSVKRTAGYWVSIGPAVGV